MDAFSTALDWAAAIRARQVSPTEVAELYLDRVDRFADLNAFAHRDDERVRAAAAAATDAVTRGDELGPFHGVPLPVKDLNLLTGWPCTFGSAGTSRAPMQETDVVIQRLVDAGFVPLGITTSPEFGTVAVTESRAFGVTRNPWNPEHTPGGSSGGAAAAVASGMAPIAHASDGGGSIRIPASCCGLVGLKPSRARVPNGPMELEGFATSGVVTRTVADTAAVLDVIGRPDPLGWYTAPPPEVPFAEQARRGPGRLRVGVTTTPALDMPVDPACIAAVERTAAALADLGHEVAEVSLSLDDPGAFVAAFTTVWNTGSAELPVEDWDAIEPLNALLRELGRQTDSISYVESVRATQRMARQLIAPFGADYDVLLTPTMATLPPRCGAIWEGAESEPMMPLLNCYPMAVFTSVWNVVGLPAVSVPVHESPDGLPVGVQVVGGSWQDGLVLAVAAQLEEALPWRDRRPSGAARVGS